MAPRLAKKMTQWDANHAIMLEPLNISGNIMAEQHNTHLPLVALGACRQPAFQRRWTICVYKVLHDDCCVALSGASFLMSGLSVACVCGSSLWVGR